MSGYFLGTFTSKVSPSLSGFKLHQFEVLFDEVVYTDFSREIGLV